MSNVGVSQKLYEALRSIQDQREKLKDARSAFLHDEGFIVRALGHLNNAEYSVKEALQYLAREGL